MCIWNVQGSQTKIFWEAKAKPTDGLSFSWKLENNLKIIITTA